LRRVAVARGAARDPSDGGKDNITIANGAVAASSAQTVL
jgi:hypothetical protein